MPCLVLNHARLRRRRLEYFGQGEESAVGWRGGLFSETGADCWFFGGVLAASPLTKVEINEDRLVTGICPSLPRNRSQLSYPILHTRPLSVSRPSLPRTVPGPNKARPIIVLHPLVSHEVFVYLILSSDLVLGTPSSILIHSQLIRTAPKTNDRGNAIKRAIKVVEITLLPNM